MMFGEHPDTATPIKMERSAKSVFKLGLDKRSEPEISLDASELFQLLVSVWSITGAWNGNALS